jgi:hypothetical protein
MQAQVIRVCLSEGVCCRFYWEMRGNTQSRSRLVARKESYIGSNAGDAGPFDVSGKHILIMPY